MDLSKQNYDYQRIQTILQKQIPLIHVMIERQKINLSTNELFQVIVKYFISLPELSKNEIFKAFIDVFLNKVTHTKIVSAIQDVAEGRNIFGRIAQYHDELNIQEEYCRDLYLYWQHVNNQMENSNNYEIMLLSQQLFINGFQNLFTKSVNIKKQPLNKYNSKSIVYIKNFNNIQKNKMKHMAKYRLFNVDTINNYYKQSKEMNDSTIKQQSIHKLYENYILNNDNFKYKYPSYVLINNLMKMNDSAFQQEFNIKTTQQIEQFAKFVKQNKVSNVDEFKTKVNIIKYNEQSSININFSSSLHLEDLSDELIISMLDNIENQLLWYERNASPQNQIIIIHNIFDNMILNSRITHYNYQQIENLLELCDEKQLYNIIINQGCNYIQLGRLRIRFLSFQSDLYNQTNIQIKLSHPQDLLTVSLEFITITNLNECENLINISSKDNTYTEKEFQNLSKLKRFWSTNDTYEDSNQSLLQKLLQTNKLEYVYVFNYESKNIVGSMTLNKNIYNLRYIFIYQQKNEFNIILNVTNEKPDKLRVFNVETNEKYGIITGPETVVNNIVKGLIHQLKTNK